MPISQEEWQKLPENIRREITSYAQAAQQAQQCLQQWDQWAEPNRQVLSRWPDVVKKLREQEDQEKARASEELTFEEVQKQTRQRARETQEHRAYIGQLAGELGRTRQQLEQIARGQQTSVNIAAHLAKWQAEDPRRDARELFRLAQERGTSSWEDATKLYDEEVAKRGQQGNQRAVRFVRPGNDREQRLNRDTQVSDAIMAALNSNSGDQAQSPTEMVWRKGGRGKQQPFPEMNDR